MRARRACPDRADGASCVLLLVALSIGPFVHAHARAQTAEAGTGEVGAPDGGTLEAGVLEAGALDAGALDAGTATAATDRGDAGVPDAVADVGPEAGPSPGATESADPLSSDHGEGAHAPERAEPSSGDVIRTILGLMFLLALAWLGGLPQVRRLEERLGITQVVTSGLPFVGLGVLMHAPGIDVLSENVLTSITPLLQFGLGWIGFHTGFQFEARAMNEVPRGTGSVVVLLTSVPLALIAACAAFILVVTGLGVTPEGLHDHDALVTLARDAIILGLAGALSAPIVHSAVRSGTSQLAGTVAVLDDVFGVAALALLAAILRPATGSGWQLPAVGWVFVTLGMAGTLGLVVHFSLRAAESVGERTAILLGSVAFTAGLAGYASIPPLVVCFLAGLVLRNLPGVDKDNLEAAFTRLERPVYLVFLLIVGALWQIQDPRGWVLLVAFMIARIAGRYLGARAARRLPVHTRPEALEETSDRQLVMAPMGQLAIALIVTAQTLYESPAVRAAVTAVIGGSILAELLVRVAARRTASERERTSSPAPAAADASSSEIDPKPPEPPAAPDAPDGGEP